MALTYINDNKLGSHLVMVDSKRTVYNPVTPPSTKRTFPKEGKTQVPDFQYKQAYNTGGRARPSNQYSNNYQSASEYNIRTRTGTIDVMIPN